MGCRPGCRDLCSGGCALLNILPHNLQSGAGTCFEGFVTCFLRVPQAVGLYCSCHGPQASKGTFQTKHYKTFATSCRPRLYLNHRFESKISAQCLELPIGLSLKVSPFPPLPAKRNRANHLDLGIPKIVTTPSKEDSGGGGAASSDRSSPPDGKKSKTFNATDNEEVRIHDGHLICIFRHAYVIQRGSSPQLQGFVCNL